MAEDHPAAGLTTAVLSPDPTNRRRHPDRNVQMIAASLRAVGAARSIVIDEGNEVLAGNGVLAGAAAAGISKLQIVDAPGDTIIAVHRSGLTPGQKRALALYDNRTGELAEWDVEQLAADVAAGLDLAPFFEAAELRDLFDTLSTEETPHASLADRFGVPPFSVLDARQGYWQDRKRAWLSLGIESELGRGGGDFNAAPGGAPLPGVRGPRKDYMPGRK